MAESVQQELRRKLAGHQTSLQEKITLATKLKEEIDTLQTREADLKKALSVFFEATYLPQQAPAPRSED